jgi:hypothetical protein
MSKSHGFIARKHASNHSIVKHRAPAGSACAAYRGAKTIFMTMAALVGGMIVQGTGGSNLTSTPPNRSYLWYAAGTVYVSAFARRHN